MEQSDDLRSGSAAAAARSAKFGRARVEHAVCLSVRPSDAQRGNWCTIRFQRLANPVVLLRWPTGTSGKLGRPF